MVDPRPGVLVGWRRRDSEHGIVLTMQVVADTSAWRRGEIDHTSIALNDRQLRSLARDLARAAHDRGMDLFAPRPWWRFWR